jgi:hypothetical protein
MLTHPRLRLLLLALLAVPVAAAGQDANVQHRVAYIEGRLRQEPLLVLDMEQARPRIAGDRSAKVQLAGENGEPALYARWKPVSRGGQGFNNEPRYELAAYLFQTLFLDEPDYVVPPTVLRSMRLPDYRALRDVSQATLGGTESVLFLLSYWLENVSNRDPFQEQRFRSDTAYARHWGNVNVLTHLIRHRDANLGNLLISLDPARPRVFAVDNDVAFSSRVSDQGDEWSRLHVDQLPLATVTRLRALTREDLDRVLGVVAEFVVVDGHLLPSEPGANLNAGRGVRTTPERVQFGLTSNEIRDVYRRIESLLEDVDRGRIRTF